MDDDAARGGRDTAAGSRPTVMFYCQHSTGLGHLVRSLAIAGALAARRRVLLCSGGRVPAGLAVPAGVEVLPLPPIGTDPDGRLTGPDGASLERTFSRRREMLLRALGRCRPEVLIVELFPLGRRRFAVELLPLLEHARAAAPRPVVVCSVRDLLVSGHPDKAGHDELAARRLDALFDAVVVHGDPRFARLEETFHPARPTRVPVHYSGFVQPPHRPAPAAAPAAAARRTPARPRVLVSAGGGLVGARLFDVAAAAHCTRLARYGVRTRILTGPFLPDADARRLRALASRHAGLSVQRFVPDLRAALADADVSVSQCGYNTSLDILAAGIPALVVPYGSARETEQPERARRLAALGGVEVLPDARLTAGRLAERVLHLLGSRCSTPALAGDGAARTAELIDTLVLRTAAGAR